MTHHRSEDAVPAAPGMALERATLDALLAHMPRTAVMGLTLDGRVDYWHASTQELLGHTANEMLARALATLGPEEHRPRAEILQSLFAASARQHSHLDIALLCRNGERLACRLDITPRCLDSEVSGFTVIVRPGAVAGNTPLGQNNGEDARVLAHRRNLFRTGGEPVWLGLDLNGDISHASPAAVDYLPGRRAELIGTPLADWLIPIEGDWLAIFHRAVMCTDSLEVDVGAVEGDRRTRRARIAVLYGAAERIEGFTLFLATDNDATVASRDRRSAPVTREQQAASEAWLTAAVHDLREPMRKMQQSAQAIERNESPRMTADGRDHASRLARACDRLQLMIDGVLRLARIDVSPVVDQPVDLDEVLASVEAALAPLISENEAIIDANALGQVVGDVGQLNSLFQNLVDNSIRYRRAEQAPRIRIRRVAPMAGDAGKLTLEYTDNSRGIRDPAAVFSAMPGSQRLVEGTGIGLGLCRRICRRHGGNLDIRSTGARGTTFIIQLDPQGASSAQEPS